MTTFKDGPAAGQRLMLRRAPFFVRVTECGGKFDALNEEADRPHQYERLYAYQMTKNLGSCHVRASNGGGGFFVCAEYSECAEQPTDAVMRDEAAWAQWCDAHSAQFDAFREANR